MDSRCERLTIVSGIKGIGAVMVILIHYVAAMLPAMWSGDFSQIHIGWIEKLVYKTPLYFFMNGSFAVYLFWTISAFLISYSWYQHHDTRDMVKKALNKYLKFIMIAAATSFVAFMLLKGGYIKNQELAQYTHSEWLGYTYNFEPSIRSLVKEIFYGIWFDTAKYNPPLWTMKLEFLGSLWTILLLELFGDLKKRYLLWSICAVFSVLYCPQYICFILGIVIADMFVLGKRINCVLADTLILAGILAGGYNWIYEEHMGMTVNRLVVWSLASGCILFGTFSSKIFQRLMRMHFCQFVGEISLYLYVTHFIVLCSFSAIVFIKCLKNGFNYLTALGITWLSGMAVTVLISVLLKKYFEPWNKRACERVLGWLLK